MKKTILIFLNLLYLTTSLVQANSLDPSYSSPDPGNYVININNLTSFVGVTDGVTGSITDSYSLEDILGATVFESVDGTTGPVVVFDYSQIATSMTTFDSISFFTYAQYHFIEFDGFQSNVSCTPDGINACPEHNYFGSFDRGHIHHGLLYG